MKFSKKIFASAVSLLFMSCVMAGMAFAKTNTVKGAFILDKTEITAGDSINLSILGLDAQGKVDLFGEQFGSTIQAVVSSQLGTVTVVTGPGTGTGTSGGSPAPGAFASDVKYILLSQGQGKVNVKYASTVSGTDTLTVTLQESFPNEQGGITYNTIDTFSKSVTIKPAVATAVGLDITDFARSGSDTVQGVDELSPGEGIDGRMTAGIAGGQVTVKATSDLAAGEVTLTIYPKGKDSSGLNKATQTYTYKAMMVKGTAIVTIDDKLTAAGGYYMKAELAGNAGDSVSMTDDDTLDVLPKPLVKKAALVSVKSVISDDGNAIAGTSVSGYVLDEYGNKTKPAANVVLEFKDANAVVSDTGLSITVLAATGTGSDDLGETAGDVLKLGNTSIVASAPADTTIAASDPLVIKVVDKNLVAGSIFGADVPAGTAFQAFDVVIDDDGNGTNAAFPLIGTDAYLSTAAATKVIVTNLATAESVSVNVAASSVDVEALFTKVSAVGDKYMISDSKNLYGPVIVTSTNAITAASPSSATLVNGHGEAVTSLKATLAGTNYTVAIPEANLMMTDAYGNAITPTAIDAGTFDATTDNGTPSVTGAGDGSLIPGQGPGQAIDPDGTDVATLTYDPTVFTGEDTITLSYTKPAVATTALTTKITAPSVLNKIVVSVQQTEIPLNGAVAVTLNTLDQFGKGFVDPSGVRVEISGDVTPSVTGFWGGSYISGQNVSFGPTGPTGREVLTVGVADKAGKFKLTFSNAADTVTVEKEFEVKAVHAGPQAVKVGGTLAGREDIAAVLDTTYEASLNVTPKDGDTPAQEWIIIGGTNNVSGAVWYFAYNGTTFALVDSAEAAYQGVLTTPFVVSPALNLKALGYTEAGGDLWYAYAYSTEATGNFKDLLDAGKIVMDNIVDLKLP